MDTGKQLKWECQETDGQKRSGWGRGALTALYNLYGQGVYLMGRLCIKNNDHRVVADKSNGKVISFVVFKNHKKD
jgi:hypothetical protein